MDEEEFPRVIDQHQQDDQTPQRIYGLDACGERLGAWSGTGVGGDKRGGC